MSGISRHALSTLCGKYKRPKGITFDTLNRLVNFFGLPVNSFINYDPDGMTITLHDASDFKAFKHLMNDWHPHFRNTINKSVYISAKLDNCSDRDELLAIPRYIANNHSFILNFKELTKRSFKQFGSVFKRNLTDRTKCYIYARILAHSGLLNERLVNYANKLFVMPLFNSRDIWGMKIGLPKRYISHNLSLIKNKTDDSKVIDKTINQFK